MQKGAATSLYNASLLKKLGGTEVSRNVKGKMVNLDP